MRATVFPLRWTVLWFCTSSCWTAGRRDAATGQSLDRSSQSWTSSSETRPASESWPTAQNVNWLKWGWILPATRRRFCPACRPCRPRGRTFKYNSFHRNTQWDRAKMDAPCEEFPHLNGVVMDTLCVGDNMDAWLLHLLAISPFFLPSMGTTGFSIQ